MAIVQEKKLVTARISGIVEHGDARGRELGFPTANLDVNDRDETDNLDGVWVADVHLEDGRSMLSTVSIGRRETFYRNGGVRLLEAYLLDFSDNLYGQRIVVDLVHYIRGQEAFDGVNALIECLHNDESVARAWAASRTPHYGINQASA